MLMNKFISHRIKTSLALVAAGLLFLSFASKPVKVLMAGEKDQICDVIDDISGYNESLEETAKNLSMPEENLIS